MVVLHSSSNFAKVTVCSFVQIRGSIPLVWSTKPNMQWHPPVLVSSSFDESLAAAKLHFDETYKEYN